MSAPDAAQGSRDRLRARLFRGAALCAVLCLAAALRFYGSPLYHPDEHLVVVQAFYMPRYKFEPTNFNYPSFYPTLLAAVYKYLPSFGKGIIGTRIYPEDVIGRTPFYQLQARFITAILGTCTVFLVYLIGRSLGWPYAGLAGAALLAVSLNHVENSHYATVDVPMAFNATVAFLFACLHYRRGGAAWALLGGIFCGLAIGTKYNGALILAPFFLCLAAVAVRRGGLRGALGALAGVAAVPYGFLLACPYFLSMHAKYLDELRSQIHIYAGGFPAYDDTVGFPNWLWNALYLARSGMGLLPALLALAGCAMLLLSGGIAGWIAACFPVLYYAYISHQAVRITRNLAVLIPFLCLAAGYALWRAGSRVRRGRGGAAGASILVAAALAQPLVLSCRYALMMGRPDPREMALEWARTHMPRGSKVAVDFMYGPQFPADTYALTTQDLGGRLLSWYLDQGYDYIVTSSGFYAHWCPAANPALAAIYPELERDFARVAVFPGNELGISQADYAVSTRPDIAVYDLRLPRYAAARITEPAGGSAVSRPACRVRWTYADDSGGGPQSAYHLRAERKRAGTIFAEGEDLLARQGGLGGWSRQSHIPGYSGGGFIAASRNAPPFRGSIRVEEGGTYTLWAHQDCGMGGRTSITLGGITAQMKERYPNDWLWERLGACALGEGEQTLVIDHAGEGQTVIDSLVLAADPSFDPARDGAWVVALDTGEVVSPETESSPSLFSDMDPGEYRVRIRARTARGRWGIWSAPVTFRLVP